MTYDEFWNGPPLLVKAYRRKHSLEMEQVNQQLWLQGLYFYNALATVIGSMAPGGNGKKEYLSEPINITPKSAKERRADAEKEKEKAIMELNLWRDSFNKAR